jgi:hypothetical protein
MNGPTFLWQSLHIFVGFFCQKLIVTSLFLLVPAAVLFDAGHALGIPQFFRSRLAVAAAGGLLFELLLIAFIRDAPDLAALGLRDRGVDSLFAYALRCETAACLLALPFASRIRRPRVAVVLAFGLPIASTLVDLLARPELAVAGRFVGAHDWATPYHAVAAGSAMIMLAIVACRPSEPAVAICAVLGLAAAAQGLLAYHGVSALSIVVCAVLAAHLYRRLRRAFSMAPDGWPQSSAATRSWAGMPSWSNDQIHRD